MSTTHNPSGQDWPPNFFPAPDSTPTVDGAHCAGATGSPPFYAPDGFGKRCIPPRNSIVFEVRGAGWIAFGANALSRTGKAIGCTVDPSWTKYGYSGGVMDRAEMIKLRDHLTAILANTKDEPRAQNL
jgi:hypothetical protein